MDEPLLLVEWSHVAPLHWVPPWEPQNTDNNLSDNFLSSAQDVVPNEDCSGCTGEAVSSLQAADALGHSAFSFLLLCSFVTHSSIL